MARKRYTPDDVLELEAPTDSFLCPLSANTYGIEFLHFAISDYESKRKIFEIGKNRPGKAVPKVDLSQARGEAAYRTIRYEFSEDVLRLPAIKTELEFSVGPKEVHELRMIERHYFRDEIVKSYDFTFGFCIPSSVNTWDAIYSMPPLDEELISSMIAQPYATVSDSFYFVGDELIMHNKAEYKYIPEDSAQAKKSYYTSDDEDDSKDSKSSRADSKGSGAKGPDSPAKWSKEDDYD
uniref:GMP phosphodiesterase delta subunit domain-containing protein n=1 Tax=Globisporangium ultimum (strain ATCC 200006 / CBS 805.95 / DAOM BR144) TaxID=431595 RepID=K3WMX7_GLOUD